MNSPAPASEPNRNSKESAPKAEITIKINENLPDHLFSSLSEKFCSSKSELADATLPSAQKHQAFISGQNIKQAAAALKTAAKILSDPRNVKEHDRALQHKINLNLAADAVLGGVVTTFVGLTSANIGFTAPGMLFSFGMGIIGGTLVGHILGQKVRTQLPDKFLKQVEHAISEIFQDDEFPVDYEVALGKPTTTLFDLVLSGLMKSNVLPDLNTQKKHNLITASLHIEAIEAHYWVELAREQQQPSESEAPRRYPISEFIHARNKFIAEAAKFFVNPTRYPFEQADELVGSLQDAYLAYHDYGWLITESAESNTV